jgi:uncharacterized integral membrane protein (TIGR00697 family)
MINKRTYKYYDLVMAGFITVLLCSNLIGPGKVCAIDLPFFGLLAFGAGNLFFPISYIFGDILTEVYGYAKTRKVIWAGFAAMIFATLMSLFVVNFPADSDEPYNAIIQPALEVAFGNTWRIVVASMFAFWCGDFINSYVMAKMKVFSKGKHLWQRTIGSTFVGQLVDSFLFYPIAFIGLWSGEKIIEVIIFNWLFKVGVEVLMTPLTYKIVAFLKREEDEDYYDKETNFTPFKINE